jgi:hypothetical protein
MKIWGLLSEYFFQSVHNRVMFLRISVTNDRDDQLIHYNEEILQEILE